MLRLAYTIIPEQPNRRAAQIALHRAGRLLLCEATGLNLKKLEEQLRFRPSRKPYLPGGPFFSISHSGRLALLALSGEGEVGCDVEDLLRPLRCEEKIREKIARPGDENEPTLSLWVRHEAEYKSGLPAGQGVLLRPPMPEGYLACVVCEKYSGEFELQEKYF
ncbi:MAG: hypothetical protein LBG83_01765 [Oscillospiraceae bacterium]|jgi:phosphopantetheinyl transferase|nr:hypothetical protein [Oscillospiraceae bacterium]